MSDLLLVIIAIELLGVLALVTDLAFKARNLGNKLDEISRKLVIKSPGGGHHGFDALECAAFSIWCFTNGAWILLAHCGQPGCDCGPPPSLPGSYEEQVIRKECPQR